MQQVTKGQKFRFIGYLLIVLGVICLDMGTKFFSEKHYLRYSSLSDINIYTQQREFLFSIGHAPGKNESAYIPYDSKADSHSWMKVYINYVRNTGAAWGAFGKMGESYRPYLFKGITILAILLIIFVFWRQPMALLSNFSFPLILGGACGNLIDRFYLHYVIDWIEVEWKIGGWHYAEFPVFNVADSAISCGAILLLLFSILEKKRRT